MIGKNARIIVCLASIVVVVLLASRRRAPEQAPAVAAPASQETAPEIETEPAPPIPMHAGVVGKNMSFFDLMMDCGLSPQEIHEVKKASSDVYDFRRIYPGQLYEVYTDTSGSFESLRFTVSEEHYIEIARTDSAIAAERKEFPFEVELRAASGIIQHSLFASLQEQDLPLEIGTRLSDIFAWDIDFFTDLRKNDYFRVIYEEKTRFDGLKRIGEVIAAEFNTQGDSHYAFLFENDDDFPDYFDAGGRSLRKQLLKAPLSYTRISSNFSHKRYHPVLHHYSPHLGIDYAAPVGTPVMSTGAGTVMTASRRRGNGNYIKIRHNQNYISYYLHLLRFAKGIANGVKVKQGQVIGYVGSSGYSTGPHLDYRVKKNGRFVNPRRLKLPPAKPVSEENMSRFLALKNERIGELLTVPIRDWRTEHFAESTPPAAGSKGAER